ncbi:MAG: hypothetical protein H8E75_04040 [Puniceicoccaceae bacterium]|nr:hypothetical protein [Puniceicoccaceae bacterium]
MKMGKSNKLLPLLRLRFAPALPLRGTSLREDGLHEAEAQHPTEPLTNLRPNTARGQSPSLSACINQNHNLQHS